MLAFILLITLILSLVPLAAMVLTFIALWKVHEKAGMPGWSGIIPFYNYYVRSELCGVKNLFWNALKLMGIGLGVSVLGSIISIILSFASGVQMMGSDSAIGSMIVTLIFSAVWYVACLVLSIVSMVQFIKIDAKFVSGFGKGVGFAIGMALLPYVFYPILAWSKDSVWGGCDCVERNEALPN